MAKQLVVLDADPAACCAPISDAALEADQAADLARMFKSLGDPIRLRLLSRITSAPGGEICVCDLTGDDFDVTGPTISHHLRVLREAGLIEGERRGTWVYYRSQPENLRQLAQLLGDGGAQRTERTR
jgi:ArsR family transcriptional regulator, arsenate/arsenite/antimonite-responsive transcriptional repressor